jgi:hypothetical protein
MVLTVKWRPSGGRGEYEYIAGGLNAVGKHAVLELPTTGERIATDVSFAHVDGKPRLRRDDSNDRSRINLPPLVAAIAGLPEPIREDSNPTVNFPLQQRAYVAATIDFDVVEETATTVVLKPKWLRPLHAPEAVDLEKRLLEIRLKAANIAEAAAFLAELSKLKATRNLAKAAAHLHKALPFAPYGQPSPDEVQPPAATSSGDQPAETDDIVADYHGTEGAYKIKQHRVRERDPKVAKVAKQLFIQKYGMLFCECCGMNFGESYPGIGDHFIEAHHRIPLHDLEQSDVTKASDLAMLCPNCHRMVHRTNACSVMMVKDALKTSGYIVNANNLKLLKD